MIKGLAPTRVVCFLLLAACAAFCQTERSSADLFQGLQPGGMNSPEAQRPEMPASRSLPDAPSVQPATQPKTFRMFVDAACPPLTRGAVDTNKPVMRETQGQVRAVRARLTATYQTGFPQKDSSTFFDRYLYPSLRRRNARYQPSTSGSFMGRATYAVSRIFILRDDSGKGRLNTTYFLGALTAVAVHSAHRPYWARSASEPLNNFGSTIGSDAGINLFHEFEPGIRQMFKGHTLKSVPSIEERITATSANPIR
jgi:hypothetical protein